MDAVQAALAELSAQLARRVEETVKGVRQHFAAVFRELAGPDVVADLLLDAERGTCEARVGFGASPVPASELSGGQRTLCAIALLFAVQRVSPAPFYLFDEVDAALDQRYRLSLTRVISSLSSEQNAQVILTTFRPESVDVASRAFRVDMRDRASAVVPISLPDARAFLEDARSSGEAEETLAISF
jgi:chromosome segregation ATPase